MPRGSARAVLVAIAPRSGPRESVTPSLRILVNLLAAFGRLGTRSVPEAASAAVTAPVPEGICRTPARARCQLAGASCGRHRAASGAFVRPVKFSVFLAAAQEVCPAACTGLCRLHRPPAACAFPVEVPHQPAAGTSRHFRRLEPAPPYDVEVPPQPVPSAVARSHPPASLRTVPPGTSPRTTAAPSTRPASGRGRSGPARGRAWCRRYFPRP